MHVRTNIVCTCMLYAYVGPFALDFHAFSTLTKGLRKGRRVLQIMKGPLGNLVVQILIFDQALNFKPKTLNPKLEVKTWRQGEILKNAARAAGCLYRQNAFGH